MLDRLSDGDEARKLEQRKRDVKALSTTVAVESTEYIEQFMAALDFYVWTRGRRVYLDVPPERLRPVTGSDEACIFMLSHDHQRLDGTMLVSFMNSLYQSYIQLGKAATCPRPAILMNTATLASKSPAVQDLYRKFGAVDITLDEQCHTPEMVRRNSKVLRPVLDAFVRQERNIFVFPEGIKAANDEKLMAERMQDGVAQMILYTIRRRPLIKVVPVGFAIRQDERYERLSAGLSLGRPFYFSEDGEQIRVDNLDARYSISLPQSGPKSLNALLINALHEVRFEADKQACAHLEHQLNTR